MALLINYVVNQGFRTWNWKVGGLYVDRPGVIMYYVPCKTFTILWGFYADSMGKIDTLLIHITWQKYKACFYTVKASSSIHFMLLMLNLKWNYIHIATSRNLAITSILDNCILCHGVEVTCLFRWTHFLTKKLGFITMQPVRVLCHLNFWNISPILRNFLRTIRI